MTDSTVHPVDQHLPTGRLAALGLQHVLVMHGSDSAAWQPTAHNMNSC